MLLEEIEQWNTESTLVVTHHIKNKIMNKFKAKMYIGLASAFNNMIDDGNLASEIAQFHDPNEFASKFPMISYRFQTRAECRHEIVNKVAQKVVDEKFERINNFCEEINNKNILTFCLNMTSYYQLLQTKGLGAGQNSRLHEMVRQKFEQIFDLKPSKFEQCFGLKSCMIQRSGKNFLHLVLYFERQDSPVECCSLQTFKKSTKLLKLKIIYHLLRRFMSKSNKVIDLVLLKILRFFKLIATPAESTPSTLKLTWERRFFFLLLTLLLCFLF